MKYYRKELPTQSWLPNGQRVNVDFTDTEGVGHLATDIGFLIRQIDEAIATQVGGWLSSDEQTFQKALEDVKKKPEPRQSNGFRADRRGLTPPIPLAGVAVAGKGIEIAPQPKPDPIRVPTPEQMKPRVGKIPKEALI